MIKITKNNTTQLMFSNYKTVFNYGKNTILKALVSFHIRNFGNYHHKLVFYLE